MARHEGLGRTAAEPIFHSTEAGFKQDIMHEVPNAGLIHTQRVKKYTVVPEIVIEFNNSEIRSHCFCTANE